MSCWAGFLRIIMCLSNAVFMTTAVLLTGFSIYAKLNTNFLEDLAVKSGMPSNSLNTLCLIGIGFGICVFGFSILGTVGAISTNKCCLVLYYVITLLCICAEVVCVALMYNGYIRVGTHETHMRVPNFNDNWVNNHLHESGSFPWTPTRADVLPLFPSLPPPLLYFAAAVIFLQYTLSWCCLCLLNIPDPDRCYSEETAPLCPVPPYEPNNMIYNEHYYNRVENKGYQ